MLFTAALKSLSPWHDAVEISGAGALDNWKSSSQHNAASRAFVGKKEGDEELT